jgi:hypothetical protein
MRAVGSLSVIGSSRIFSRHVALDCFVAPFLAMTGGVAT